MSRPFFTYLTLILIVPFFFSGCSTDDGYAPCDTLSQAKYELKVTPEDGGTINVVVIRVIESYSGGLGGVPPQIEVDFEAIPYQGYVFTEWRVLLEGPDTPQDTPAIFYENPLRRSVYCEVDNYRKFLTLTAVFDQIED